MCNCCKMISRYTILIANIIQLIWFGLFSGACDVAWAEDEKMLATVTATALNIQSGEQIDATSVTPHQLNFFETKIRPVLVEHCYECHAAGDKIVQGGLYVDHREGLLNGGDSGAAIVPGDAEKSLLVAALRYEDLEMPPKGKLPQRIIDDFKEWIAMGAPDPRRADAVPTVRAMDLDEGRKHWAFQPVADPLPPLVKDESWPINAIDRFIRAKQESVGLQPVADADRYTWLRRVSLDLTGVPPTPEEIDAFVRDNSPRACEIVVDRLLESRGFGERWARHWLDLTGYADMVGTSNNVFAEHAWRYRDYLVDAFNKDKPFDCFVREQIAGDLLPTESSEGQAEYITATGFLMLGDVEIVEPDKLKMEADHIDTQVNKIGTVFMGMTLGCVRCHDHKFDPIALTDYYGIAGMLRSSPSTHKIPFGVWSMLNSTALPETPKQLAARMKLEREHEQRLAELIAERDRLGSEPGKSLGPAIQHAEFFRSKVPQAFAMCDGAHPADMPIYIRGNPYSPGAVVPRGVIKVASWKEPPEITAGQSGRLQLADWLADRRNPLTARVAVNRVWQKLFGEGLVRSVDYFGTRGETPSHPELLDHLASRFMQNGWSQKRLIRSIVLSRTYRLSSMNDAAAMQSDHDNRLLWRMHRQRLDAEAIRDSLLAVSGELLPSNGGPALVLEELENCGDLVQQGVNPPNYNHRKSRPEQEFQRSIYLPVLRTNTMDLDRIRNHFDFVNPAQIAGQRAQTVVATQSLFVMNNELFRKRAKALADRLITNTTQLDERVEQLWMRVFNRPVTLNERNDALAFLRELEATLETEDSSSRESLCWQEICHSLLASNEFLFRL
jgi:hypothetical protein